jgi:hypothetical protein
MEKACVYSCVFVFIRGRFAWIYRGLMRARRLLKTRSERVKAPAVFPQTTRDQLVGVIKYTGKAKTVEEMDEGIAAEIRRRYTAGSILVEATGRDGVLIRSTGTFPRTTLAGELKTVDSSDAAVYAACNFGGRGDNRSLTVAALFRVMTSSRLCRARRCPPGLLCGPPLLRSLRPNRCLRSIGRGSRTWLGRSLLLGRRW